MRYDHAWAAVVIAAALTQSGQAGAAATQSLLYDFTGKLDGANPSAGVIIDRLGALYGVTSQGGAEAGGTVFKLTPPAAGKSVWTETVLHSFGGPDGVNPQAPLLIDQSGALYGTTLTRSHADGAVFKLTPPAAHQTAWTETLLHSFGGEPDGAFPMAGVIAGADGALYGATSQGGEGGRGGNGVVYKLDPPAAGQTSWKETILHKFTGAADGAQPQAGLVPDGSGGVFGSTSYGGVGGFGVVFRLAPPAAGQTNWTETVLHSFDAVTDGAYPVGAMVLDRSGVLYGVTASGGVGGHGVAFKLTPPAGGHGDWTETVLHSFTGGADGSAPQGGVIMDGSGALVGATAFGGSGTQCFSGCGVIFKLIPPATAQTGWKLAILHDFTGPPDGADPQGPLVIDAAGWLYGAAAQGGKGAGGGDGLAFRLRD